MMTQQIARNVLITFEGLCLVECDALWSGENTQTFRKNVLTLYAKYKIEFLQ